MYIYFLYNIYVFYQGDLAGAFWQLYHAGMHEYTGGLEPVAGTISQNSQNSQNFATGTSMAMVYSKYGRQLILRISV